MPTGGTANVEADHDTMTAEVAIAVGIYFSVATRTDGRANEDLSSAVSSTKVGQQLVFLFVKIGGF
jgi:hypothetical protein